jgi:broad specificity phosphatase PhoE
VVATLRASRPVEGAALRRDGEIGQGGAKSAISTKIYEEYRFAAEGVLPIAHFITHPEVVIDSSVPVPDWRLSADGVRRMELALQRPWLANVGAIFSSAERKATDAAGMIAARFDLFPVIVEGLGENDRSATGYLPKAEFEAVADAFFARPEESVRGWERAADAQRRIVAAAEHVFAAAPDRGDIAVVFHGGVGALLLCHFKGVPISRAEDQPGGGGGNVFSFDTTKRALLSGWRRIED